MLVLRIGFDHAGEFQRPPDGRRVSSRHDDNPVPALMTVNKEGAASWQPDRVRYNFEM
jgi:hypothetical protein